MKKWLIAGVAGMIAVIAVTGAALALIDGSDTPQRQTRSETREDNAGADCAQPPCDDVSGGAAGICLEGALDCDDTVEQPVDDDVCIQIHPTPPECADPDEPVSSEPPATTIDGQDPNECNLVHNIEACKRQAVDAAIEDLVRNTAYSAESFTVDSVEFVEWPDACLGVENPKLVCAEVITPGFNIVLSVDGGSYGCRTNATGSVLSCGK